MKVHKLVLMVVDFDELGAEEVAETIENQKYPNHCISPQVIERDTREVEWNDSHPLNQVGNEAEFLRLFSD